MPGLSNWFYLDSQGWWITIPTAALFASCLVWVRGRPGKRSYAPLLFVGFTLVGAILHYIRADWHQHFGNHVLWISGLVSLAAAAPLPPLLTLLVEWASHRVVRSAVLRVVLAAVVASFISFGFQRALAFRAADLTFHVAASLRPNAR